MFQPPKILVAVDFGACSKRALEAAASIARSTGGALHVLHVYEPPYYAPEALIHLPGQAPMPIVDYVRGSAEAQLEQFASAVRADTTLTGGVQTHLTAGLAFQAIPQQARALGAGLVVLGTHGRHGLSHVLLGSVAERVVRDAPCPLLVVRDTEGAPPFPAAFDRVLVPVDFGPDAAAATTTALDLVGHRVDALHLAHVVPAPAYTGDVLVPHRGGVKLAQFLHDDALELLGEFATSQEATGASLHVLQGGASEHLIRLAVEEDAQLIVMGTRGRHGLAHFFVGSVAERVLRHTPCPVLIVRATY
jgi:nucleotide-binding universal stress UspA family protein